MLRITKYADRLISDLDLVDFPEKVKTMEKDWIGKSIGYRVSFSIKDSQEKIEVFTTRIDTIFGVSYLVLSPEHQLINLLKDKIENFNEVKKYIEIAKRKSERERVSEKKDKTGVVLKGLTAINPANNEKIPIFIADYVLSSYGTGAIMAVPAHDRRDFDFAKKYNLPIIKVIEAKDEVESDDEVYSGEGKLINSTGFNGMDSLLAKGKIGSWLAKEKKAQREVNYKLRDWLFSRQRYWGEPIPLVFCQHCKEKIERLKKEGRIKELEEEFSPGEIANPGWIAVPEKDLPVKLPRIKNYKPTEEGDSPLAANKKWVETTCPKCGRKAYRETDVMPNWAGSNWYFLRYCDPKNNRKLADQKKLKYWMPVDWYNGGMEHTNLHLLYSRFIYKFLWDIKVVPRELGAEPYKKRTSHGMILGEGGIKMSKSKGNVVNPDDVIKNEGADILRIYEMFMGPFSQEIAWDTNSLKGARKFLQKVFDVVNQWIEGEGKGETSIQMAKVLHRAIKKISQDIDELKFNTAISSMMEFVNYWQKDIFALGKEDLKTFIKILAVFAPHLGEELWQIVGGKKSVFLSGWPSYEESLTEEEKVRIVIQVNGKVRGEIEAKKNTEEEIVRDIAFKERNVEKWLKGEKIKKTIFVKNKLINFVI